LVEGNIVSPKAKAVIEIALREVNNDWGNNQRMDSHNRWG
jgi:hypothetical protein